MSNLIKIAIPLINDEITLKDLNEKTGFYGAYLDDINRPWLTNHVFLLYDLSKQSVEQNITFYKFKKCTNLHSIKYITINNKVYKLFTFTSNKTINNLSEGTIVVTDKQNLRILQFWEFKDNWINSRYLSGTKFIDPKTLDKVPEEDYLPELDEQKMGSGITIDTTTH